MTWSCSFTMRWGWMKQKCRHIYWTNLTPNPMMFIFHDLPPEGCFLGDSSPSPKVLNPHLNVFWVDRLPKVGIFSKPTPPTNYVWGIKINLLKGVYSVSLSCPHLIINQQSLAQTYHEKRPCKTCQIYWLLIYLIIVCHSIFIDPFDCDPLND